MIDTLFRKGDSFLHRYDCRLKLLILPLLVISFFMPVPPAVPGGFLLFLMLVSWIALGWGDLVLPVRMIYPLLILILLLTPLFYRQGECLICLRGTVLLTERGLMEAGIYIFRFLGITVAFFLLFRTTPMEDILLGLSWFRLPYLLTLIVSVALRYIPHLAGLYTQISAAHSLRCSVGDAPPRKGLFSRVRRLFPILVSLMIQGVKTIPVLAMALELKGIGRDNPRSRLRTLSSPVKLKRQLITTVMMLVLMILILVFYWRS